MHRTTILLPAALRAKAESVAKSRGITMSELIRRQLATTVRGRKSSDRKSDPLFAPTKLMRAGGRGDIAARHDEYLYGPARAGARR
jgi:uncharacterized membrane-anchored protein